MLIKREIQAQERKILKMTLEKSELKKEILTEKFGEGIRINLCQRILKVVNEFLTENFAEILDYGFTAKVEQDFDNIASGTKKWEGYAERIL